MLTDVETDFMNNIKHDTLKLIVKLEELEQKVININAKFKFKINEIMLILESEDTRMSWMKEISKYCEALDLDGLTDFLGNEEVATGFMKAHVEMRKKKNDPAYKELNKIHDKLQNE